MKETFTAKKQLAIYFINCAAAASVLIIFVYGNLVLKRDSTLLQLALLPPRIILDVLIKSSLADRSVRNSGLKTIFNFGYCFIYFFKNRIKNT